MLIRVEIPIDAPGIDALLRRSFESDAEAKLVHDLREDGFLTLGLVATDDEGQVVGYVAFSPVDVQGEDLQWVGMAPLAVDEKYRGQGLARQLRERSMGSRKRWRAFAACSLKGKFAVWRGRRATPRVKLTFVASRSPGCCQRRYGKSGWMKLNSPTTRWGLVKNCTGYVTHAPSRRSASRLNAGRSSGVRLVTS